MKREQIIEKIGVLNKQVLSSTEELEEMEFNITKKKLEIKKCKNAIKELKISLRDFYKKKPKNEKTIRKKYDKTLKEKLDNYFYSQENVYNRISDPYCYYIERNVFPYND